MLVLAWIIGLYCTMKFIVNRLVKQEKNQTD